PPRPPITFRPLQGPQAGQLLPPILKFPLKRLSLQPLLLPDSEIRILDRQLASRGPPSRAICLVERSDFSDQDSHRPSIAHDMVQGEEYYVFFLLKLQRRH